MIKEFDSLKGRFRHSTDRFATCFEAVCVLCQYKLEHDRFLFDILIPAVFDDTDDSVAKIPPEESENDEDSEDDDTA
jgi:hypothetical protein